MAETAQRIQRYSPTTGYRLTAVVFILAAIWLGSEAWRERGILLAMFFAGFSVVAVALALGAFARAEFDGETLVYRFPLRPDHRIAREQISLLELGGRRTRALVIGYHARGADGSIDSDRLTFVNLVPLKDQLDLLDLLGGSDGPDIPT